MKSVWPALVTPTVFDCSHQPDWDSFRRQVDEHARNGWPMEGPGAVALEQTARTLENRWRYLVCSQECRNSEDFRWGYVEAMGADVCHDSPQFERYVVVHYPGSEGTPLSAYRTVADFNNRNLTYRSGAGSGGKFCFYGYVAALVVLAQFAFPRSVAYAQRYLYIALAILGDFFAFDWLDSSGWPVRLLDINIHLSTVADAWRPLAPGMESLMSRHPGERGAGPLQAFLRWEGTGEAAKRTRRLWCQPHEGQTEMGIEGNGKAKTMFERFERTIGVRVRFIGNSIGHNVCGNYGLCASPDVERKVVQHLYGYSKGGTFDEVSPAFVAAFRPHVAAADVLMCTQPPAWCRFLLAFADKPVFMYIGLPLMWDVHEADRMPWLREFAAMAQDDGHVVVASSVFLAHEVHWQAGVLPPVQRLLGLHTGAAHTPVRNDSVLFSRFGTSAGMSECVVNRFLGANPWYPLRFVQLEEILFEEHRATRGDPSVLAGRESWANRLSELRTPGMPYRAMAEHRAAVLFPYDAVIFLFHELYSMQVPVFVPRDLWRWLFGPLTLPRMEARLADGQGGRAADAVAPPPGSPFFAEPRRPLNMDQALYWAGLTDWALLPHVHYFRGAAELLERLLDGPGLRAASARMKTFNEDQVVLSVDGWRRVAWRLLHASQGAL
ncbi:unnamed protein product [Prorocentrum cordatum]|uniref:Uncharacterized protein n=1 Tax=Prorocentrum cordatum TaxID=2364126 RepID=A0ABN9U0A0_9DINO|nr:unnamed protein product [Polarella glacialis]